MCIQLLNMIFILDLNALVLCIGFEMWPLHYEKWRHINAIFQGWGDNIFEEILYMSSRMSHFRKATISTLAYKTIVTPHEL